jgi:predicted SAM-dependent methyltransferase
MNRLLHIWRQTRKRVTADRCRHLPPGGRLHVGCGPVHLDGWINIDNRRYDAADYIVDVRDGLPFHSLKFIFAEHFIEHLPYWEAVRFLHDCRSALAEDGILRLSTPNLDWVYRTQYGSGNSVADCFSANKAFRAWGHQFLYNLPALTETLQEAGFARVETQRWGESSHPGLRGLEKHEQWPDTPELPHVLVIESSGTTPARPSHPAAKDFLHALGAS